MSESKLKRNYDKDYSILLDCLRSARRSASMTQVELSEKLGVDQSYISKYERGERRIDVVELRTICAALNVDLSDFIKNFEERLQGRGSS